MFLLRCRCSTRIESAVFGQILDKPLADSVHAGRELGIIRLLLGFVVVNEGAVGLVFRYFQLVGAIDSGFDVKERVFIHATALRLWLVHD